MEFEGKYRVKKAMAMTDNGFEYLSREALAALDDEDYAQMLKMIICIDENALSVFLKPTEADMEFIKEEGLELNEEDLVPVEQHEIVSQDGEWKYECGEEDGETMFMPLSLNDEGDLIYGEMIILEKL